ncbi:sigma-54 dependent transcriptional regulator [Sphingomonas sp. S1-29]|uniref:sigma 54-interacting transcriptional regulator n=1 Tax=Sphingomonas sp. S1-29 TaxID=2991074 RepID=UPI00223FE14F|nr:sigma-54 dependent transcriptional regulator [Sphingomonas sp. S1-29]UZK70297.1 sigma-54 dependent transcriptional regulator [Sphingomonas sp. S1-29]
MKPEIVHASDSQRALLKRLDRVAPTDAEILISGPSGVGKELFAAYVHAASHRRDQPFVAVNCANLSEDMLENEIFGHARGAFTGAQSSAHGIAAAADGGTLFLDEIDALPLPCQAKILRFAQLREYRRLGETFVRRSDVRLIAASNVDLLARVRAGLFREDLYFRLRVVPVDVLPLVDRPEDIPVLLAHFVAKYARDYNVPPIELSPEAEHHLHRYPWPGNVRELENCVRCLTCLRLERPALVGDLPLLRFSPTDGPEVAPAANGRTAWLTEELDTPWGRVEAEFNGLPLKEAKSKIVEGFERIYLDSALQAASGNVAEAARRSGKHRRAFFELMRRYGVQADDYRG